MTKSIIISQHPEFDEWECKVADLNGLPELQAVVGGFIEAIPTSDHVTIWVNEEGKITDLPRNPIAEAAWAAFDKYGCLRSGDWLAGPAIIQGPSDEDGHDSDVPQWIIDSFIEQGHLPEGAR